MYLAMTTRLVRRAFLMLKERTCSAAESQKGPSASGYFPIVLNGQKDTQLERRGKLQRSGGKTALDHGTVM